MSVRNEVLLAYLAGIFDGEGSVGFYSGGKGRISRTYVFTMEVKMTYKPIIDLFYETFGGSVGFRKKYKSHYKDQWRWRVVGPKARDTFMQLKPYLRLKTIETI